ncbi:MAG: TldD/PmbA family protein [Actinomycetota bacterium]|nr:TldD/PmbA family protein [Actinomycetota bacterium]
MQQIDPSFTALPLRELADAALSRARELGCTHADLRVERLRTQNISLRDARLESATDGEDAGLAVRVVHEGTWGFAAGMALTTDEADRLAEQAVAVARVSAAINTDPVEMAPEPAYPDGTYISSYEIDPFTVPDPDKIALLVDWSERLMSADGVEHVQSMVLLAKDQKFYADLSGTSTIQQRVRVHPQLTAVAVDRSSGAFETMRTLAAPAARGWEYLTGDLWDWSGELAEIPELLREKIKAPSVQAGRYDLIVDPSNLFLTIHESIGHATELDRALGYEAAYAGTSFATIDKLGTLQYGSPLMNVTGDRNDEFGLASIGYDDEGVAAQQWDIVKDGVLVGYQLDRNMARLKSFGRSNGCAFADSPGHVPVQRMANVSLQPAPDGPTTEEMIAGVERGIYVVGDKSWSIDMQRYNFQFTGQRFYKIESGRLAGQLRDVAYQATTTDFWGSMSVVGGPSTYVLGGAFNCGKAQPGQVAAVSHGCPSALFDGVNILNTVTEGGR